MKKLKTVEEVREDFRIRGISISQWARQHRLSEAIVSGVLRGEKKGLRGESHRAAVLLGIKDGLIEENGHGV